MKKEGHSGVVCWRHWPGLGFAVRHCSRSSQGAHAHLPSRSNARWSPWRQPSLQTHRPRMQALVLQELPYHLTDTHCHLTVSWVPIWGMWHVISSWFISFDLHLLVPSLTKLCILYFFVGPWGLRSYELLSSPIKTVLVFILWNCLSCSYWCHRVLSIFWILTISLCCKYLCPICGLSFYSPAGTFWWR